ERLPRPGLAGHQAVCQIDVADRRDDALLHREWSRVSAVGEERSHPRSTHRGGPRAGGSGSRWKMPPLASGFVPWSVAAREEPVGRPSGPLAPGLRRTLSAEAAVREAVIVHVAGAPDAALRAPRAAAVDPGLGAVLHEIRTRRSHANEIGARPARAV